MGGVFRPTWSQAMNNWSGTNGVMIYCGVIVLHFRHLILVGYLSTKNNVNSVKGGQTKIMYSTRYTHIQVHVYGTKCKKLCLH